MKQLLFFVAAMMSVATTWASNVVGISPLTEQILLVHFDDGYVRHHLRGEARDNEWVVGTPLDVALASQLSSYTLSSIDHGAYANGRQPTDLGRKSKGTDFTWLCEGWAYQDFFGVVGCDNSSQDHAKEHWVYLFLPHPLQDGATYTLTTADLAEEGDVFTFTYDKTVLRSEAVHVNNLGYSTDSPAKYGYVYHWLGDKGGLELSAYAGNAFWLYDQATNTIAYEGTLTFRQSADAAETFQDNPNETPNQNFVGAAVYECDFSGFNQPGDYRLVVDGVGASFPFSINCDVYREAYQAVIRGLFMNRSGIELTAEYTDFPRPVPHHPQLTPGFGDRLMYTTTTICDVSNADAAEVDRPVWESGIQGNLTETWGWYQDAGDWDGYPNHSKIPAMLLLTYEHFSDHFPDGELNVPESDNGLPDLLDEARWLIRFYKRVRDEITALGWGSGGVGGARVMGDLWGEDLVDNIGAGSWEDDHRMWIVSGEDPYITYTYAALAGHLQYLYERDGLTDPEGIDWQAEATSAYLWAQSNEGDFANCNAVDLRAARAHAAAALFRLTGSSIYEQQLANDASVWQLGSTTLLENEWTFSVSIYLASTSTNGNLRTQALSAIINTGDVLLLNNIDNRGCRWGGNIYFPMLVGQPTTPLVFPGIMASKLLSQEDPTRAAQYRRSLYTTADYFLGNNPLNMTWITGLGDRFPQDVFHLDSWYSGQEATRPGIVPYGPWRADYSFTNIGPWDRHWAFKTVYPAIDEWPGHERWFNQRTAPLSAEFTVHQNQINAIALYGALSGDAICQGISNTTTVSASINELQLFPNPAQEMVQLSWPADINTLEVELLSVTGQRLSTLTLLRRQALELGSLPAGAYWVRATAPNGNEVFVGRLVKI